jgi:hypothetical protein
MFRGCKVNKKIFVLFLVPLLVVAVGGATLWRGLEAEAANSGTGTLNVVHGIPDAEVDICARGEKTEGGFTKVITGFNFEDIETLELPEGNYAGYPLYLRVNPSSVALPNNGVPFPMTKFLSVANLCGSVPDGNPVRDLD